MKNHLKRFYNGFGNHKNMVLSTVYENKIHSRMMSLVLLDNKFYFQTDKNFLKCRDIESNNSVSLCIDDYSIEGLCNCIGKPVDNKRFCEVFEKAFPKSFELYTFLESEMLYEIEPKYIKRWIYDSGKPYIEIINIDECKYEKIKYEAIL